MIGVLVYFCSYYRAVCVPSGRVIEEYFEIMPRLA